MLKILLDIDKVTNCCDMGRRQVADFVVATAARGAAEFAKDRQEGSVKMCRER